VWKTKLCQLNLDRGNAKHHDIWPPHFLTLIQLLIPFFYHTINEMCYMIELSRINADNTCVLLSYQCYITLLERLIWHTLYFHMRIFFFPLYPFLTILIKWHPLIDQCYVTLMVQRYTSAIGISTHPCYDIINLRSLVFECQLKHFQNSMSIKQHAHKLIIHLRTREQ
jgi:hypothetical protein